MIVLTEEQVRDRIRKYFHISELVGSRTYDMYKDRAWRFLDYRLLYALLIVREGLNRKIWVNYGDKEQRGLRTNVQRILKRLFYRNKLYISAHVLGKAVDFDVQGLDAWEVRAWILKNEELFPFKIRLEDKVSWVHLDVIWEEKNNWVYLFDPPK